MRTLMIAAGGGGDAIAATAMSTATDGEAIAVATLAWDRLIIDPIPGPRAATDFTGLTHRAGYHLITPTSRPIPPAGSTLPRLAGGLPLPLILLDPTGGAVGIRTQIAAAMDDLNADTVALIDVGGDILGRPGDTGLRSPLADALTAAAAIGLPTTVWIAGPGLDGELAEATVLDRIGPRRRRITLTPDAWTRYSHTLEWHPSEATALLAAASTGLRGRVEIRDAGLPANLTDHSADAHELPLSAILAVNPLPAALHDTRTLTETEQVTRQLLGWTELDTERTKARRLEHSPPAPIDPDTGLDQWENNARQRGVDYTTFRHLAEVLHQPDIDTLRTQLITRQPERFKRPLWSLR